MDDRRFESSQPLGFEEKVAYLDHISFWVKGSASIDAVRVTRLPDAEKDR